MIDDRRNQRNVDTQCRVHAELIVAACAHVWRPDAKRSTWDACARCKAIRNVKRDVRPRLWTRSLPKTEIA